MHASALDESQSGVVHGMQRTHEQTTMRLSFALIVLLLCAMATPVSAKGCLKGAVVGGVAGHYAGHHGVIGAAVGCVVGRHQVKKRAQTQRMAPQYDRAGRTYY
jgi:hypothetical protein